MTNRLKRKRGIVGRLFTFLFSIGGLLAVFLLAITYGEKLKPKIAGLHPMLGNLMSKLSGNDATAEKPLA